MEGEKYVSTKMNVLGGLRIKLDLKDFVHDGGGLRWMFLAGDSVATVRDLVDKLRSGRISCKKLRI